MLMWLCKREETHLNSRTINHAKTYNHVLHRYKNVEREEIKERKEVYYYLNYPREE